jgi:hypothetical protein
MTLPQQPMTAAKRPTDAAKAANDKDEMAPSNESTNSPGPMIPGGLRTTAMAILPHRDVDRALDLALSLDIPFWPQLPHVGYYEDMYVQASEHFPGVVLDPDQNTLHFDTPRFYEGLEILLNRFDDQEYFDISPRFSVVYHRFLGMDLSGYEAIRGQLEGPISFGLKVLDENGRPLIFNEEVRPVLIDFMARRVNAQLRRLKEKNPRAFMFIDEPGLQFIFSSVSGYTDIMAREDFRNFFDQIDRPRGVHLCGNPDWDFLLKQDMEILSFDAYRNGPIFTKYQSSIQKFLDRGGVLAWGLVPTQTELFTRESVPTLIAMLEAFWENLYQLGFDREQLLAQSLLSPATCCLVNPDFEKTVEAAFEWIREISRRLRDKYRLD